MEQIIVIKLLEILRRIRLKRALAAEFHSFILFFAKRIKRIPDNPVYGNFHNYS